jgi:tetratricopeptide (TPR) repeat protein
MLRAATLLLAVTLAALGPMDALAQDANNEYYASRGTKLLHTVEQYHLYPGEEKFRQRNFESAFGDFTFILKYFPNHPRALLLMVQLCSEWKSPHCSLDTVFDNALAVKADAPGTYVVKGIYLHRIRRYADAIDNYRKALELDPDSVNAHYNAALTYLEMRQYDAANRHAQRAYALGAQLPGLRQRLQKAGHWDPAAVDATAPTPRTDAATPRPDAAPAPAADGVRAEGAMPQPPR